jgi:hypothetical protein
VAGIYERILMWCAPPSIVQSREKNMLMRKSVLLAATLVALTTITHPSSAQGPWAYLGEANVDGGSDHDRIKVGAGQGTFRALQIQVERAAIDFQYVLVHFENGGSQRLPLQGRVPAGGRSRIIDLKGNNRAIDSVEVWYSKGNWANSQKPKMRLYGRR